MAHEAQRHGRGTIPHRARRWVALARGAAILVGASAALPVLGQTFDEAVDEVLGDGCEVLIQGQIAANDPEILRIGPNLARLCGFFCISDGMGGIQCAVGDASAGGTSEASAAQHSSDATVPGARRRGRDRGEASDVEVVAATGRGPSVFVSAAYEDLEKEATAYEDGYDSSIERLTLGADWSFTRRVLAGAAGSWSLFEGDTLGGGEFRTESLGGVAWVSWAPSERGFVDLALDVSSRESDRVRQAQFTRSRGFPPSVLVFGGPVGAGFDATALGAHLLAGTDYAAGRFTLGPRVSLSRVTIDTDAYEESGGTGLELRVAEDARRSFRSGVGAFASAAIGTSFGVLSPQLGLTWIHEHADDPRDIVVEFAEDDRADPVRFSFETESPDRDFVELDLAVAAVLRGGVSWFADVRTLVGNSRYDSWTGSIGLRLEF